MCTSFDVFWESEKLASAIRKMGKNVSTTSVGAAAVGGRKRPTDLVPVIRLIEDEYCLDAIRWGFKLKGLMAPMVNSRIEEIVNGNAAEYWQSLLKQNPCLFVMSGFHEFKKEYSNTINPRTGKPPKTPIRKPFRFTLKDENIFFCAGYFREEGYIKKENACTLITTEGNDLTNMVHDKNRMPVIMDLETGIQFLEASLEERIAMCRPYPPDKMNSEPTVL